MWNDPTFDVMHGNWHWFFGWHTLFLLLVVFLAAYGAYSLARAAAERGNRDQHRRHDREDDTGADTHEPPAKPKA